MIAGSVTVHVHDGGEAIVPDGRRLYAAETLHMTAWDADPAHAELDAHVVYRWQEREAERDPGADADRDPRRRPPVEHRDRLRPDRPAQVDVDGSRFFERDWTERIPRNLV